MQYVIFGGWSTKKAKKFKGGILCDNHARLESIYLILSQWRTYTPTSDTLLSTLNIEMESAASFEDKCIARCKAIISNPYLAVENAVQAAAHEMACQEKQLLSNVKYRDSAWCIPKDLKCSSNKIICMPFIENIKRSRLSPKWIKMVWWLVKNHCLKEIRLKSPLRLYHTNGSWQRCSPRCICLSSRWPPGRLFSWLGLASASHGLASVVARSGR